MAIIYQKAPLFARPQIKPRKWGSDQDVRRAVRDYYENKLGVAAPVLYIPIWEKSGSRLCDYSGKNNFGFYNTPTLVRDGLLCSGATASHASCPSPSLSIGAGQYTIFSILCPSSLSAASGFFAINSYDPAFAIEATTGYPYIYDDGSGIGKANIGLNVNVNNAVAVVRYGTGTNQVSYYVRGAQASTATHSHTFPSISALSIGSDRLSGGYVFTGIVVLTAVWGIGLPSNIISVLSSNPYAAIQPRSWPTYFFVGGGAAPSTYFMPQFMNHKFIPSFTGGQR